MRIYEEMFQRFAEGGPGAAGGAAGAGATAGAADAGQQEKGGGAGGVKPGSQAGPDAEAGGEARGNGQPAQSFEELIKGPYREQFDAKVQGIVKGRLAKAQKTEAAAAKMQSVMDVLAQRYGMDGSDYDGILSALDSDTALYEAEAAEQGMDVNQYMHMQRLERETQALRRMQEQTRQEQAARAEFADVVRQSEELKKIVPSFDLSAEMANPNTVRLLHAGIPLQTVYEVNHRRELQQAAAAAGAQRVAASVAANKARPNEAGQAGTGASTSGVDPTKLTKAQREEIKRRVANGERIVLSELKL